MITLRIKKLIRDEKMNEVALESAWVHCPFCRAKTKTKVYTDSILLHFPLYCPKCKREMPVDIIHGKIYPSSKAHI